MFVLQISDCGMVLEEQPAKVSEAFRLFLQGEGYGKWTKMVTQVVSKLFSNSEQSTIIIWRLIDVRNWFISMRFYCYSFRKEPSGTILREINIYECFGIARTHAKNTALHKN